MNSNFFSAVLLVAAIFMALSFSQVQGASKALLQQPAGMPVRVSASNCGSSYVIRSGDTLSAIARRCGVSVTALAQANGLRLNSVIYAGRRLVIPGGTAPAPAPGVAPGAQPQVGCPARYTVRSGDTLGAIARRCGVSVANLRQWNNLRSDLIRVGQVLNTRPTDALRTPVPPAAGGSWGAQPVPTPVPSEAPVTIPPPTPAIESPVNNW